MKALVQFSTGAGSALVAYRAIERYGVENTVLLTANTHVEDEDNWRFAIEVWQDMGQPEWQILSKHRTPMQIGRDVRVVPNNRLAVCSRILKRELLRDYIEANYDPNDAVIMLGFDWTEPHRLEKALPLWEPWKVEAPLMDPPLLEKPAILGWFHDRGIATPRLYDVGFSHANCGGACVRGGQAQWKLLLQWNPERYREWENEERLTRVALGKNVAILRDRRGGESKPLTLRAFRTRIQNEEKIDEQDWGACGCYMGDEE